MERSAYELKVCRALSYCVWVDTSRIWEEYYRPKPVSTFNENESERDGPILESERDEPKVGVIPAPVPVMRRSQHLLEKNSEGNRLIPASACVEERQKRKSSMSFDDFRNSTGMDSFPLNKESPSLSQPTGSSNSTLTASASSIYIGPLSCQGPPSSLLSPSLGSSLRFACYFRARNNRKRWERHHQLIKTISARVVYGRKPPGRAEPVPS